MLKLWWNKILKEKIQSKKSLQKNRINKRKLKLMPKDLMVTLSFLQVQHMPESFYRCKFLFLNAWKWFTMDIFINSLNTNRCLGIKNSFLFQLSMLMVRLWSKSTGYLRRKFLTKEKIWIQILTCVERKTLESISIETGVLTGNLRAKRTILSSVVIFGQVLKHSLSRNHRLWEISLPRKEITSNSLSTATPQETSSFGLTTEESQTISKQDPQVLFKSFKTFPKTLTSQTVLWKEILTK